MERDLQVGKATPLAGTFVAGTDGPLTAVIGVRNPRKGNWRAREDSNS